MNKPELEERVGYIQEELEGFGDSYGSYFNKYQLQERIKWYEKNFYNTLKNTTFIGNEKSLLTLAFEDFKKEILEEILKE